MLDIAGVHENVAPLAGAWIEISLVYRSYAAAGSLPSRERGLKLETNVAEYKAGKVAPLAGAWIEIYFLQIICINAYGRSPRGSVD